MGHRLGLSSKLKPLGVGAAKASLNRATELDALDPKPSVRGITGVKVQKQALAVRTPIR